MNRQLHPAGSQSALLINVLSFVYIAGYALFDSVPGLSKVSLLSAVLIVLLLLWRLLVVRQLVVPKLLRVPIVFAVLVVAAMLWAADFSTAWFYGIMTLSAMCGAIAIWISLYNGLSYRTLLWAAITGALVVTVASITSPPVLDDRVARSMGTFNNPNVAGVYLTCCAFIIASPAAGSRRISWTNILLAIAVMVSGVVFTGSRKTIISIVLLLAYGGIVLAAQSRNRFRWVWVLTVFSAVVAAAILVGPNPDISASPLAEVSTVQRFDLMLRQQDESAMVRRSMIYEGIDLWLQSPWVGHGYGQFASLTSYGTYSHCNYVELLCSTGLLGTLLFYSFYLLIVMQAIRLRRPQDFAALTIVIVLLLTDMAAVSNISKPSWVMTILAAYLAASANSVTVLSLQTARPTQPKTRMLRVSLERVLRAPTVQTVLKEKMPDAKR